MKIVLVFTLLMSGIVNLSAQTEEHDELAELKRQVAELKSMNEQIRSEYEKEVKLNSKENTEGVEYRIQLGIQNTRNVLKIGKNNKLKGTYVNGKLVYDIGGFSNPEDAYNLSQDFRKLNLSGAFVTRYVNGVRDFEYTYQITGTNNSGSPVNFAIKSKSTEYTPPQNSVSNSSDDGYSIGDINVAPPKRAPGVKSKTMSIED